MRAPGAPRARLAAALAAALLGACTLEVEGAPCRTPGGTSDCPGGQACGNDLRCSARALACWTRQASCTPGAGGACLDPTGLETAGATAQARRCTDSDPVCGAWVVEPCAAGGLECRVRAPAGGVPGAWCGCADALPGSRELLVRPEGTVAGRAPFPTGAAVPLACAFRRLGDALAAAALAVDPGTDPTAVATVTVTGAAAGSTRTFSAAATGEVYPLVIPDRVALRSDAGAGSSSEIVFDSVGPAQTPVELHSGGALAGFTIRNGAADATHDAVVLRCDGRAAPPRLSAVVLDGRGAGSARLGRGLLAGGTCGLAAAGLEVRDVSGPGVLVEDLAGGAQVTLTGGSVQGCGEGVVIGKPSGLGTMGRVVLDGVRIAGNAGMGLRTDALDGTPRLEVRNAKVVGNGDTGIALAHAIEARITGTTVYANGAATSWGGPGSGLSGIARRAGGLVLQGNPPAAGALELGGNRIYGNLGDQLLVFGLTTATATWNLDGPACAAGGFAVPLTTHLGCYDPDAAATPVPYKGLVSVDAALSARNLAWRDAMGQPDATLDYSWFHVDPRLIGTATPGCLDHLPANLDCGSEDPP
jgi:hypothetical protein